MTLRRSGRLFGQVRFVAVGRIVRAVLGTPYAKYQVKHGILPRGGASLPAPWRDRLKDIAAEECRKALGV
jgi:hypothetical protein